MKASVAAGRSRLVRFLARLHRLLLRAYPRSFHDRYASELDRLYRQLATRRLEQCGRQAVPRLVHEAVVDPLIDGLTERLRDLRRSAGLRAAPLLSNSSSAHRIDSPPGKGAAMRSLTSELKSATRSLLQHRSYSLTASLTLALGLGFGLAMLALIEGVLLDPLSYPHAERLAVISERSPQGRLDQVSVPNFLDWREQSESFIQLAAGQSWGMTYTGGDEPRDLPTMRVSPNLLSALGVTPVLGRDFVATDGVIGRHRVALVSDGFWRRQLGGDPGAPGISLKLDGEPYTVVGVLPPGFSFPPGNEVEVLAPIPIGERSDDRRRRARTLEVVVGLLAERQAGGVASLEEATQEMGLVAERLAAEFPDSNRGWTISVQSLRESLLGRVSRSLWLLCTAVGVLLLVACLNVSSLMSARLSARRRELAVRAGLGASWVQLARLIFVEGLLLAAAGGVLGLALAAALVGWIRTLPPTLLPRAEAVQLDLRALGWGLVLTLAAAVLCTVLPAFRAGRFTGSSEAVGRHLRASRAVGGGRRLLGAMVVAEIALAMMLAVAGGLLARSLVNLLEVDPGFRHDRVLTANLFLPEARYPDDEAERRFFEQLLERLAERPGIESVGAVSALPMDQVGIDFDLPYEIVGRPHAEDRTAQVDYRVASSGYFSTLGIPLLHGRTFDRIDRADTPLVAVINRTLANRHFGSASVVGEIIDLPIGGEHLIVGVVGDLRHRGPAAPLQPEVFVPFAQRPFSGMVVAVRTTGDPLTAVDDFKETVWGLDPEQPLYAIQPMRDLVRSSLSQPRFSALLLAFFATASLLLALIGIYGVTSYSVSQRSREIGVRIALGANIGTTLRMVLREGLLLAALGLTVGLVLATAASRLLEGYLHRVDGLDPATYGAVVLLFALVSGAACYLPARRAARTDPKVVLDQAVD